MHIERYFQVRAAERQGTYCTSQKRRRPWLAETRNATGLPLRALVLSAFVSKLGALIESVSPARSGALHCELETGADIGRQAVIKGAHDNIYIQLRYANMNIVAEATLERKRVMPVDIFSNV